MSDNDLGDDDLGDNNYGFKNDFNEICCICVDKIKENKVRLINCNHSFHKDCIEEWFRKGNLNCPICRQNLKSKN